MRRRALGSAFAILTLTPSVARADDAPPPLFTATFRDILDGWGVEDGHLANPVVMNRAQVTATLAGDSIGLPGLAFHAQVFNYAGASLSARTHDIQTADAIDAVPMTRLFEAWIEQRFGSEEHNVAIRAGLMDVNVDFDSIVAANWLVNSSQGIGADIARSGLNGPSIYPVSSLGVRVGWTPNKHWTARLAVLDGVPGDLDRPQVFVAARLAPHDGAFTIGQVDWRWSDKGRVAVGAWRGPRSTMVHPGTTRAGTPRWKAPYPDRHIGTAGCAMAGRPGQCSRSMAIWARG
jgi:porin